MNNKGFTERINVPEFWFFPEIVLTLVFTWLKLSLISFPAVVFIVFSFDKNSANFYQSTGRIKNLNSKSPGSSGFHRQMATASKPGAVTSQSGDQRTLVNIA